MTRIFKYAWLALAVAFMVVLATVHKGHARITGANPVGNQSDTWCVGKSADEVCVDASGNFVPTTTSTATLGTSGLQWQSLWVNGTATLGTASVGTVTSSTVTASLALQLPSVSSTTLKTITFAQAGLVFYVVDSTGAFWSTCVTTGTTTPGQVVESSSTKVCRQVP